MKRKRALLGSNPPRNSRLETHSDGGEPTETGRLPPLDGCQTSGSSSIGVDLRIPQKPILAISLPQRDGNRLGGRYFRYVTKYKGSSGDDQLPIRYAASGRSCGSTVAWCPPLRRQTRRLEVVRRSPPRNVPALLTRRIGGLLHLDLRQHG